MLFIKATRNGLDFYATFDGMTQATVAVLLTDLGCTSQQFLASDVFAQTLAALPKTPPIDIKPLQTALDNAVTTDAKVTALVALLKVKGSA